MFVFFLIGRYAHRNASNEERLLAYLFQDYDPVARAVMDTSKPVNVYVDFVLLRIHGLVSETIRGRIFQFRYCQSWLDWVLGFA